MQAMTMENFKSHASAALVICLVLVLTGCGGKKKAAEKQDVVMAEKMVERAIEHASGGEAKVDISEERVSITSKEGSMVISGGTNAQLPASLPEDVPIYKGAGVMQSLDRGEQGFSLMLQTQDDVGKVIAFYKAALKSNGWASETPVDMPGRAVLPSAKGNRALHVIIVGGKDATHITIAASLKDR